MTNGVEKTPDLVAKSFDSEIEVNNDNVDEQEKQIYKDAKKLFKEDKNCLFVGGDHSISYTICTAFFEKFKDAKLVILDAHPDLMIPMKNPTHEEWLRALVEKTKINPEHILLIGVRRHSDNIDQREIKYAEEKRIKIIYSSEMASREGEIMDFVRNSSVYLSIDIDFIDSSVVSSTGYPEEGGPSKEHAFELIRKIKLSSEIKSADLVEVNTLVGKPMRTLQAAKEIIKILNGKV